MAYPIPGTCYPQMVDPNTTWVTWMVPTQTSSSTTITDPAWVQWSCSSSTITGSVWVTWTANSISYILQPNATPYAPLTEEQQLALVEAAKARQEQETKRQEERKRAAEIAMNLLKANLNKKQQQALDKHGWFLVEGGKSKKTYRIYGDRCAGNIQEYVGDRAVAQYCVHAEDYNIPLGDNLLAQALCLKYDEDHIIGKANKTALAA